MQQDETFRAFIDRRFSGGLLAGTHRDNGKACVLEAWNAYQGLAWSDSPVLTRIFDIRPLNDVAVSPAVRTEWMTQLLEAYAGSLDWPEARQRRVVTAIVLATIREIIAELPGLPDTIRQQCRSVTTLAEAVEAAAEADRAARAAAEAARAAGAAAEAAEEEIFVRACRLWLAAVSSKQ